MKDYYENDSKFKAGERVMAFDCRLWDKNGGDSKQDLFMRSAIIVKVYREGETYLYNNHRKRMLANVQFDHDNRVCSGKFLYGLERIL